MGIAYFGAKFDEARREQGAVSKVGDDEMQQ